MKNCIFKKGGLCNGIQKHTFISNLFNRYFLGPVKMPLKLFKRCCGPEEMKWRIPKGNFESKVEELKQVIEKETDLPPLRSIFSIGNRRILCNRMDYRKRGIFILHG